MKKLFASIVLSILVVTAAVAKNDVQLCVEPISLSSAYIYTTNFSVTNHLYFGEKQMFGVGEKITYSVYSDKYTVGTVLAGPAFACDLKVCTFQFITGFKYSFGTFAYSDTWMNTNLLVTNTQNLHQFEWGNDIQFKLFDEDVFSFVVGVYFAFGGLYSYRSQAVKDEAGYGKYEKIHGDLKKEADNFSIAPYLGVTYNW